MKSISKRLINYVVSVFAVVFFASMLFVLISTDRLIEIEAEKTAEHTLESISLEIEKSLLDIAEDTKDLRWNPVLDDNSKVVSYRYVSVPDPQESTSDWYRIPMETGKPVWTEPYESEVEPGTMVFAYGYPVMNHDGIITSVAMTEVSLDWLTTIISEDKFKPYEHSATSIMSGKYVFLASNNAHLNLSPGVDVLDSTGVQMIHGKTDMGHFDLNGQETFFVTGQMDNGWTVIIVSPYSDVFEGASLMRMILLLTSIFSLMLFYLVIRRAMASITRPLRSISSAAHQIAQGNFEVKLPQIKHDDEVRELKDSFDYLQSSLTTYIANLRTTTAAKERLESELSIAHKIQQDLLPTQYPANDLFRISSLLIPAKEVGGDLYDYSFSEESLHFSVGDVSGKGIPASLLMSSTQSAYRFNKVLNVSPKVCMERINNYLSSHNFENMFVTMFAGTLDLKTYRLEFCNAGHNRIVVYPPEGNAYLLEEKPNFVLGIFENFEYVQESVQLEKGTALVLYSDGVTEAENGNKEMFGDDRLLDWATRYFGGKAGTDTPATSLLREVQQFTAGNEQNDDITIVVVEF